LPGRNEVEADRAVAAAWLSAGEGRIERRRRQDWAAVASRL